MDYITEKSTLKKRQLILMIGIARSKFYNWVTRIGVPNRHNGNIPREHWILCEEREAIINFCKDRILEEGYRRLTYIMLDNNIVAISPSTTYRVLKAEGLLKRWNEKKPSKKGTGFIQPQKPHEHWHVDITYVNILGTVFFLIIVLDGFSRFIVSHDLRRSMTEYDVELTIQRAIDKFPNAKPRIISDRGGQFISKEFKEFIKSSGLTHVKTSPYYPQSNGKLERFNGTIKQEEVRKNSYISDYDGGKSISIYVDNYNDVRLHSSISYLPPRDVLEGKMEERLDERRKKLYIAKKRRRETQARG